MKERAFQLDCGPWANTTPFETIQQPNPTQPNLTQLLHFRSFNSDSTYSYASPFFFTAVELDLFDPELECHPFFFSPCVPRCVPLLCSTLRPLQKNRSTDGSFERHGRSLYIAHKEIFNLTTMDPKKKTSQEARVRSWAALVVVIGHNEMGGEGERARGRGERARGHFLHFLLEALFVLEPWWRAPGIFSKGHSHYHRSHTIIGFMLATGRRRSDKVERTIKR